ncbi:ferroptosis suppressor protein 1-like isoform X2 [Montipora capricornis]|uniref:ferroptosis suppressor protein 1-like isoform X2 n=1 Tax=Montipora capricornis TaxID=246305 RepID=UPI0035F10056
MLEMRFTTIWVRKDPLLNQIKEAMKIGVVGGGAVGVEIAGDIMEDYKDKADVYLIHPRENLVNDKVNESFQSALKAKLTSLGVNVILGERVINMDEVKEEGFQNVMLVTDKGRKMKVDLVIPCTGLKVHTVAYKNSLSEKMDSLGRLQVDEFLQVKDVSDVYAIGDCNDVPEIKLAYGAETQGKYIAEQIKLKHEGKTMSPYNVNSTLSETAFLKHVYTSNFDVTIFICSRRRGNLSNFLRQMYLLKGWLVSFYVTSKSCHIRKNFRERTRHIKCGKFMSLGERPWRTTRQPRLVSALSLLSEGNADPLNNDVSTIIICCSFYTIKCICHRQIARVCFRRQGHLNSHSQ